MELMVRGGDYLPDGRGGFRRAEGDDELLQRVLWKLSVRRGSFPFLPELGSLLGQDVLLARLGALVFQVDGVANYRLSAPLEDVEIGTAQLPVLGELTVTQLEESA